MIEELIDLMTEAIHLDSGTPIEIVIHDKYKDLFEAYCDRLMSRSLKQDESAVKFTMQIATWKGLPVKFMNLDLSLPFATGIGFPVQVLTQQ